VAVGDEAAEQMREEVPGAAMPCMLDLADVLELVVDCLDNGAFAQQEFVGELHEHIAHVSTKLGDEADAMLDEEALGA
jgi:hypothetical protein